MLKVAVVTPYYKEDEFILDRCHRSVVSQRFPCTHILVADGYPRSYFDGAADTMHVRLPAPNGDNGNTPRAIGGILAQRYGFDAVAYLDADNWYENDHISSVVDQFNMHSKPIICVKRQFFTISGTRMDITQESEEKRIHVDTSCITLFRGAFKLLQAWLMPKQLGPVCDRIFIQKVRNDKYDILYLDQRTVCFQSQYLSHYAAAQIDPPAGAKTTEDVFGGARAFLSEVDNLQEISETLGFFPVL